jgi:hypothetical protein
MDWGGRLDDLPCFALEACVAAAVVVVGGSVLKTSTVGWSVALVLARVCVTTPERYNTWLQQLLLVLPKLATPTDITNTSVVQAFAVLSTFHQTRSICTSSASIARQTLAHAIHTVAVESTIWDRGTKLDVTREQQCDNG